MSPQTYAADLFWTFGVLAKEKPDLAAIRGEYADSEYQISDNQANDPSYMIGGKTRLVLYLGSFLQIYGGASGAFSGTYPEDATISDQKIDFVNQKQYYQVYDAEAEAMGRIFLSDNFQIFGGMAYRQIEAKGDYKDLTITRGQYKSLQTLSINGFRYFQSAQGYKGGFRYVPNLISIIYLHFDFSYGYFEDKDSNMEFQLYGDVEDKNSHPFFLHLAEASVGIRLLAPYADTFEFELGIRSSYSRYEVSYGGDPSNQIHKDNTFSYTEFIPYVEFVFPL